MRFLKSLNSLKFFKLPTTLEIESIMTDLDDTPLLLLHAGVDRDGREAVLRQQGGEGLAALDALDKDDDLVEVKRVKQAEELAVLLLVQEVDVVLLETVQGQLGLVVNVDLHGLKLAV